MVKVIVENGKVKVQSEYNAIFVKKAKAAHGFWNSPYWIFQEENEEIVRDILMEVYGEDGRPCEKVTVDLFLDEYDFGMNLNIDSLLIASRPSRDRPVRLSENAFVRKGMFLNSGGSVRNPEVTCEKGTVVRVRDVPLRIYEKVKNLPGLVLVDDSSDKSKIENLMKEKEYLISRLQEIDIELKKMAECI